MQYLKQSLPEETRQKYNKFEEIVRKNDNGCPKSCTLKLGGGVDASSCNGSTLLALPSQEKPSHTLGELMFSQTTHEVSSLAMWNSDSLSRPVHARNSMKLMSAGTEQLWRQKLLWLSRNIMTVLKISLFSSPI